MTTTNLSELEIVNQAFETLGENPIASLTEQTRRAQLAAAIYPTERDALLEEHPWRLCRVRATLYAYVTPAANITPGAGSTVVATTGVTFTASTSVFTAADVGKTIRGVGVNGIALITSVSSGTVVLATITSAFAGVLIAAQSWRLYSPTPPWGYSFSIERPADCLRIWIRSEDSYLFQVEQDRLVSNADAINVLYTRRETDTTKYPPTFVQALVAKLTAAFAEGITGQAEKVKLYSQIYEIRLRLAKARDSQEGTPRRIRKDELIVVRMGGGWRHWGRE